MSPTMVGVCTAWAFVVGVAAGAATVVAVMPKHVRQGLRAYYAARRDRG